MKRDDRKPVQRQFWYMRWKGDKEIKWFYDLWSCGSAPLCRMGKARAKCQPKVRQ